MRIMENGDNSSFSFFLDKFSRGIIASLLALFLAKISGLLAKIFLSRLGVETFGLFNLLYALVNALVILTALGLPMGVNRFVSFYSGRKNIQQVKNVILTALLVLLPLSLLVVLLSLKFSFLTDYFFHFAGIGDYFRIIILSAPLIVFVNVVKAFFSGQLEINRFFLLNNLEKLFYLLLIILFLSFGWGLFGAIFAFFLANFFVFLLAIFWLARFFLSIKTKFIFFKELFKFSWPVSLSELLRTLTASGDVLILSFFKGSVETGRYSALFSVAVLVLIVPQVVLAFFLPLITNFLGKKKDIKPLCGQIFWWLYAILLPLSFWLIFQGETLVKLLFGLDYLLSGSVLVFLITANFVYSFLVWPSRHILDALGKTKLNLKLSLIRFAIFFIGWLILVPSLGSLGIGLGFFVGWLTEAFFCSQNINRLVKFSFINGKYWRLLLIVFLLSFLVFSLNREIGLFNFIVKTAVFFTIYALVYYRLFFSAVDRRFLTTMLSNVKIKKRK